METLRKYRNSVLSLLTGSAVLLIPLIRELHFESALIAALIGCFWAGWVSATSTEQDREILYRGSIITGLIYLAAVPLVFRALIMGCFSFDGFAFWLFLPLPSIFFGIAAGRMIRLFGARRPGVWAVVFLCSTALIPLLIEFKTFPQVYFFNHVWGAWPGPIYDEQVHISGSLLYYRLMTMFWILLLWFIPSARSNENRSSIRVVVIAAIALIVSYSQAGEAGIVSPRSHIQESLGGHWETKHFDIYYAEGYYSRDEISRIALEHEWHLQEITDRLNLDRTDASDKIESYLYAHAWQKKRLVGAKFTSYVPVWLEQDQLHIAKGQIEGSLRHELVHVLAKQFGNRLFNASWSIGLIEGLAVALAPDRSATSTVDQLVAADKPYPTSEEMEAAATFKGFYTGRSSVNYTTMGSFVAYLLEQHPVELFKAAYRTGDPEAAYDRSFDELVAGWHRHLDRVETDTLDEQVASRLFGIPSIFEKKCPHNLSEVEKRWDEYRFQMAEGDTGRAVHSMNQLYHTDPHFNFYKPEWAFWNIRVGNAQAVAAKATVADSLPELQLLFADARQLDGSPGKAVLHLQAVIERLQRQPDSLMEESLMVRLDSAQWAAHLEIAYGSRLPDSSDFVPLYYRTKIRALNKAVDQEKWDFVAIYARLLLKSPVNSRYMGELFEMIHILGFRDHIVWAEEWIDKLGRESLRPRDRERLEEERAWLAFIKKNK